MMRFFYEELVMRNTKLKKMIILSVGIMFLFILGIIILYQTPYAPKTFFSDNGRYFTLPFLDMTLQSDPPEKKLIKHMEKKYDLEFYVYDGKMFLSETYPQYSYHEWQETWDYKYNGIIVATQSIPNHYFYVRSLYGYIIDDYAPHIVYEEAQNKLHDMLAGAISAEFRISCIPQSLQTMEFENEITVDSYLKYGEYDFVIIIHSDGENRNSEIKNVCDILYDYYYGNTTIDKYYDNPPNIIDFDNKPNKIISFNYISTDDYYNYEDDIYAHPEYEFDHQMEGYIYRKADSYDLIPRPTTDLNSTNQFWDATAK